jgi:hypothetical protein
MYKVYLFFHIFGAIVWIGLGITGHALGVWATRNREWDFGRTFSLALTSIEPAAIVAGPLLLLGTGIGMVLDGPWSFTDTWIVVGLSGYAAALALGAGFQGPGMRRLEAIMDERGADDPSAIALVHRMNGLMWLELAVLLIVLLAMATKPTGAGPAGFWIAAGSLVAASVVLATRDFRAASATPASAASPPA